MPAVPLEYRPPGARFAPDPTWSLLAVGRAVAVLLTPIAGVVYYNNGLGHPPRCGFPGDVEKDLLALFIASFRVLGISRLRWLLGSALRESEISAGIAHKLGDGPYAKQLGK